MTDSYMGQIVGFGFNWPPRNWGLCIGTMVSISQNQALYSLLGTTFGGDGRTTFALPDLRGRAALNFGTGPGLPAYNIGQRGGTAYHQMTTAQMPSHNHQIGTHNHKLRATTAVADATIPTSTKLLGRSAGTTYATPGTLVSLDDTAPNQAISEAVGAASSNTGGNQAFSIENPYLAINMSICMIGIYPSRN